MVVVAVSVPEVPVTVIVEVPGVAVELAVNVSTLVPVAGLGASTPVTPLGRPDTASVTLPVNPPVSVTLTVSVPLALGAMDTAGAEDERAKLPAGTVKVNACVLVQAAALV